MPIPLRASVLGCPVDVVDMGAAVERVAQLVDERRRAQGGDRPGRGAGIVVTLNPEIVMRARRDAGLLSIVRSADLVIPDGVGVVLALRRRGHGGATRVTGVDLLEAYLPRAAELGHRIAFAGAAPGVAEAAARRLCERVPALRIVAVDSGPACERTARRIAEGRPDVLCAAYGGGRQERFLHDHLGTAGAAVGIGVGGALDFLSGAVRRAPARVREARLEWAWRLLLQPWRLRRQLVLPLFWWQERREVGRGA